MDPHTNILPWVLEVLGVLEVPVKIKPKSNLG